MPDSTFVNLENARHDEQRAVMEVIAAAGVCPFCPDQLKKFHSKPVLRETKHWMLTENQWPYENTRIHLLAIYKTHAEKLKDLNPNAGRELLDLMSWAEKKYRVKGGGFGVRFGDPKYNGGTVKHLHAQFIVADTTDPSDPHYKPVRLRLG